MSGNKRFTILKVYNYLNKLTGNEKDKDTPVFFIIDLTTGCVYSLVYYNNLEEALAICNKLNKKNELIFDEYILKEDENVISVSFDEIEGVSIITNKINKEQLNSVLQKILISKDEKSTTSSTITRKNKNK